MKKDDVPFLHECTYYRVGKLSRGRYSFYCAFDLRNAVFWCEEEVCLLSINEDGKYTILNDKPCKCCYIVVHVTRWPPCQIALRCYI